MSTLKVQFPNEERPTTDVSMGVIVFGGLGITVAIFGAIYPFKGSFIRDLLMGRESVNLERVIFQGLTLWMWALSLVNIVLKFIKLRTEQKVMREDLIPEGTVITDIGDLVNIHAKLLQHPQIGKRVGITRVARVLSMWINTEDFERTAQYAKQENEMDIYASDSSYRANRLFIWAMPLLGFVGTVYGVSYGIGGFAEFLRGNVTSEEIKYQVGLITEGLAVAFYCTLLGLMTAGIAAFPSLAAERKEEETLGIIDEYVEARLVSRMPSNRPDTFPKDDIKAMRRGIENIKIDVHFPMDELTRAIDEGFRRLPDPDRYERVFTAAIAKASDLVMQKYDEFARAYEHRIGDLGTALAGKFEGVAEAFRAGTAGIAQELNAHVRQITAAGDTQAQRFEAVHEKYLAALAGIHSQEMQRWDTMSADFRRLAAETNEQFRLAGAHLNEAAEHYTQRLHESAQGLATQLGRVSEVAARVDQMLNSTRAMDAALSKIGSAEEFGRLLDSLSTHLAASDELAKRLAKPRKIVFEETTA